MKKLIIVLIAVTAGIAVFAQTAKEKMPISKTAESIKATYICPMHADITSDKPGKCPKCGMDLSEAKVKSKMTYTCPMHPNVISDKSGKCPKCGMDLVEKNKTEKTKSKKRKGTI